MNSLQQHGEEILRVENMNITDLPISLTAILYKNEFNMTNLIFQLLTMLISFVVLVLLLVYTRKTHMFVVYRHRG